MTDDVVEISAKVPADVAVAIERVYERREAHRTPRWALLHGGRSEEEADDVLDRLDGVGGKAVALLLDEFQGEIENQLSNI